MKPERLDRGRLAALIDGRLKGADRNAALAELAAFPDDLEIVADAAAVAAELDSSRTDVGRAGLGRGIGLPFPTRWLGIAATIVLAAVLAVSVRHGAAPAGEYASLLNARGTLPLGWADHSWSTTRGAGDGLTERARAVRTGALTSAIDIAAARGDSATGRLATQVAALLADLPGSSSVVSKYRDIARQSPSVPSGQLRDARLAARGMVSTPAFDDGAWLEVARIAATSHDSAFFAATASREQLARLERDAADDARARNDVGSVRRLIEQQDWDNLAAATTTVLTILAGT